MVHRYPDPRSIASQKYFATGDWRRRGGMGKCNLTRPDSHPGRPLSPQVRCTNTVQNVQSKRMFRSMFCKTVKKNAYLYIIEIEVITNKYQK